MQRRTPLLATAIGIPISMAMLVPGGAVALPDEPEARASDSAFVLTEPSSAPAEKVAVDLLRLKAADYGVSAADLADLQVSSQHTSEHNGVTYVYLAQHFQGRAVAGGVATVSVAKDGVVLHVAESLVANLREATGSASLDARGALEAAAEELELDVPEASVEKRASGAEQATVLSPAGISQEEIPARQVWQPTEDGLRLAWELVIDEADAAHLWQIVVDAETGEALSVEDWTDHDHAGHLHGLARGAHQFTQPSVLTPRTGLAGSPNPVIDGSSYRVFAFPAESPNDADRTLVTNPADATASPYGWHDFPGGATTTTRGNNVHAYTDRDNNNSPDPGSDSDGGPDLTFDFPLDQSEHSINYPDAAVTNLFYNNNMIHDILYNFGFTEDVGNFQVTNYTGEGTGGDDVQAEAMDGGGTNNANFSTPAADGGRPRMQMYLWPGTQFGMPNGVTIGTGEDATTYEANFSAFSPAPTNAGLPGDAVVVDNTCARFSAPGAVVVTSRTNACNPHAQALNAQAAGAVALVISHNAEGETPPRLTAAGSMEPTVSIPMVSVTQADGAAMRTQIADGDTAASVHKMASHPGIRDGDYENGIIIHEYGHGVSNRLTGGLNINCLSGQEQMGEGWSDYLAITMLMDPALDDPEQARGMGPYALFQDDRSGGGIRPRPYSRDMNIQPFTYDRIKTGGWLDGATLATPHGVGHAWAATLWDMNWDLVDKHGFTEDLYGDWDAAGNTRAMQYVMDGMKMQGCFPGFVDGRNGILAASEALGGADTCNVWSTFARRGLGYSAIQGTSADRNDNTEAFDVPPTCEAPGTGFASPLSNTELNDARAGATTPVRFSLDGYRGENPLRAAHSPMIQEIDCDTREPLQYAISVPTEARGQLSYTPGRDRYQYNWNVSSSLAGSCQQMIITLEDGTQHRADFSLR